MCREGQKTLDLYLNSCLADSKLMLFSVSRAAFVNTPMGVDSETSLKLCLLENSLIC